MRVVLLSGGSGQRLWPLSNDLYSKQYIKFVSHDPEINVDIKQKCSMLQRVYEQLVAVGLGENVVIAASEAQKEIIFSQLPEKKVDIAVEPMRRDTFPAVVLACAYLHSKCSVELNEIVAFVPVDPYVNLDYFRKIIQLAEIVEEKPHTIGLLGALPTYASEKYGYILNKETSECYSEVIGFEEKPIQKRAEELIESGSLWNCGVFCFALGTALEWAAKYGLSLDYDQLVKEYMSLPKISFDYEVLEHWDSIISIPYEGVWKDIGTWNTLTEEMQEAIVGLAVIDETCTNCHVINTLDIPLVVMGGENMIVSASHDGILVADKQQSANLKKYLEKIKMEPRYEERRWGTIKTIDRSEEGGIGVCTNKIKVEKGQYTTYHCHHQHDEIVTIISGTGILILEEEEIVLLPGVTVTVGTERCHAIYATEQMHYIEVLLGNIEHDDIERKYYEWGQIKSHLSAIVKK